MAQNINNPCTLMSNKCLGQYLQYFEIKLINSTKRICALLVLCPPNMLYLYTDLQEFIHTITGKKSTNPRRFSNKTISISRYLQFGVGAISGNSTIICYSFASESRPQINVIKRHPGISKFSLVKFSSTSSTKLDQNV